MQYDTFQKFLVQLHGIFDGMEFDMLDVKGKGYISGLELARSLVAPGPVTMIDALLDRVCSFFRRLHTWSTVQRSVRLFCRNHSLVFMCATSLQSSACLYVCLFCCNPTPPL